MTRWGLLPFCACALAGTLGARATDLSGSELAAQMVSLFMRSCVHFAGQPTELRAWTEHAGVQPLSAADRQAFLYGLPGEGFDATTALGKLVLISENSGACSALAESASGPEVVKRLEQAMQASQIDFTLTHEDDDKWEQTLHHREYTATQGPRQWEMLVSTVNGAAAGEVVLTTSP